MTSMISLIVVLLAAYAYSAPVMPELQNATVAMEFENATSLTEGENVTVGFHAPNLIILAHRGASVVANEKKNKAKVSLSSSSESDSNETTDRPSGVTEGSFTTEHTKRDVDEQLTNENSERDVHDTVAEENSKRDADEQLTNENSEREVEDSFNGETNKREAEDSLNGETDKRDADEQLTNENSEREVEDSFNGENSKREAEDSFNGENSKREADESLSNENTRRGIEVESFESSTAEESSTQVQKVKRSLDDQPSMAAEPTWKLSKRSVEIVESSTDVQETSTGEHSSVPSTSEVNHIKRNGENFPSLTTEASEAFNRRAIGSVESVQSDESSTVFVIKVQPESTTEEQRSSSPSSSSTVEYVESTDSTTSTSDYETTVVPVEESSRASPMPSESTAKILAIIPGTISRTQYVVPPVRHVQLSQGENQTIVETKKPNY